MNSRHIKFLNAYEFAMRYCCSYCHCVILTCQDDTNANASASAPSTDAPASTVPEASHPLMEMAPDLPELEGRDL